MNRTCLQLLTLVAAWLICSSLTALAANAQKPVRPYSIRYTSGRVTNAGWEKVLCDEDPNLKHWNWSATSDYTQSYKRVAPGSYGKARPQSGVYAKPVHLSPLTYAKPRADDIPIVVGDRATIRVRGQAIIPGNDSMVPISPPVLSYGSYLKNPDEETGGSFADSRKVRGQLIKKKTVP